MGRSKTLSLWLVLLIVFLDWMGIGLVYPMFSAMLFEPECPFLACGASNAERGFYLGVLLASMSVAQFFSGPILGALSDQKGRKPIFIYSLSLGVVAYLCCMGAVWIESLSALIFSRILIGIAAGNAAAVSAAIADLSDEESKAKNFGLYSMAFGVGFTIGPYLGGVFSGSGFYVPFLIAAFACFLNLILIIAFYRETNHNLKKQALCFSAGLRNLKKAFLIPKLRSIFLAVLLFCFGWSFYYEFLPVTWISDFQFDAKQIGFFFAYGAGWYALSSGYLIRPLVNRFRPQAIFFYALCLLGVFLLSTFFGRSVLWIWLGFPVSNFLASLLFPTSTTMVSNWAGKDAQGETLGILQSVQSAAFAFSPLAAGALLGESPHMPMILGGLTMLLAALVVGVCLRKQVFSS
jgi:DHA1 family tetracycline resistance protein-like MFS transporter